VLTACLLCSFLPVLDVCGQNWRLPDLALLLVALGEHLAAGRLPEHLLTSEPPSTPSLPSSPRQPGTLEPTPAAVLRGSRGAGVRPKAQARPRARLAHGGTVSTVPELAPAPV